MAIEQKSQRARYGRELGFVPPVSLGCKAWYDFGDPDRKRAPYDKIKGLRGRYYATGTLYPPVIDPNGFVSVGRENFHLFGTRLYDTPAMTVMVAAKLVAPYPAGSTDRRHVLLTNHNSTVTDPQSQSLGGFLLGIYASETGGKTIRCYINGVTSPAGTFARMATDPMVWALYAAVVDPTAGISIINLTTGASVGPVATAQAAARVLKADRDLRAGVDNNNNVTIADVSLINLNHLSIYNRALSGAELVTNAEYIRARAAAVGIVI